MAYNAFRLDGELECRGDGAKDVCALTVISVWFQLHGIFGVGLSCMATYTVHTSDTYIHYRAPLDAVLIETHELKDLIEDVHDNLNLLHAMWDPTDVPSNQDMKRYYQML